MINKKIFIISGIITLVLVMLIAIIAIPKINIGTDKLSLEQQQVELENQFTLADWAIDDNTVYVNDDRVFLAATPHTLETGSGWVVFNVTSKVYTGDVDLTIGVDTPNLKPTRLQVYNPTQEERQEGYTCGGYFNYTVTPKHFWCYQEYQDINNNTAYNLKFEHDFESGDLQAQTAYWTETYTSLWKDVNKQIDRKFYKFQDVDTWYILKEVPVNAGQDYAFRIYLKQPINAIVPPQKYWFAIKPSALTIKESIQQDKLYALDPWTNTTGLVFWYDFSNLTSNINLNIIDKSGQGINGTYVNIVTTPYTDGKIGSGIDFPGVDELITVNGTKIGKPTNYAMNFWINPDDYSNCAFAGGDINAKQEDLWGTQWRTATENMEMWGSTGAAFDNEVIEVDGWEAEDFTVGVYEMVTFGLNSSHYYYYKNGTIRNRVARTIGAQAGTLYNFTLSGLGEYGIYYCNAQVDEFAMFNYSLDSEQISELWNAGVGLTFSSASLSVNVTYPLPIIYNETVTQLNYTYVSGAADKCWYSTNNGTSNSSTVTAGNNFTVSSQPEWNTWKVWCNESTEGLEADDNVTFFVNKSVGVVLIAPITTANLNTTTVLFQYNATTRNTNITNVTHLIWFSNGTNFLTNTTAFGSITNVTQEMSSQHSSLIDDTYTWTAKSCGLDVLCIEATNFTFTTHTVTPGLIITAPSGALGAVINGATLNVTWNVSETGEILATHITNCSYMYNSVRTDVSITNCIQTNTSAFTYVSGVDTINFTVVDAFNFTVSNTSSWIVTLSEVNQTWNNNTVEGASEDFTIFATIHPSLSIDAASLIYNGTSTVGTLTNPSGQLFKATETISVPSVDANQNVSFFWRFTLNDTTTVDGLTKNQSIQNLDADDCSVFNGSVLYNFTVVDEELQTEFNATRENLTTEADLQIFSFDRSIQIVDFSSNYSKTNPFAICLTANLSDATQYSADLQVRYEATDYAAEFYNVQNGTLQNSTLPQNITLYDLDLDDSTEFLITYKGGDFLPVEDALITITRKYIAEGLFKTVEIPITDSEGQAIAHLDLDSVIYTIIVTKEGEVLATFNNVAVVCQDESIGDCKISLNEVSSSDDFPDWEQVGGVKTATTFDEATRTVTTIFTTTDGSIKQIQLNATKFDRFSNTTVCTDTLNAAAGTLTCTIPISYGNVTILTEIAADGEVFKELFYSISPDTSETFGDVRYIFMFILLLTIPLLFIGSSVGMLVGAIVGLIIASVLAIIDTGSILSTTSAVMWLIIAIGIVIWKITQNNDGL